MPWSWDSSIIIEPSGPHKWKNGTRWKTGGPALLFCHQLFGLLSPAPLTLMGNSIHTKLFAKSVWALAWAIFWSHDASIWLLLMCPASLCPSVHTGPLLSSPHYEHSWRKSATVKRYTLDADEAMQHNNSPQEPMTETELHYRLMAMITTGSAWVKPRSATRWRKKLRHERCGYNTGF